MLRLKPSFWFSVAGLGLEGTYGLRLRGAAELVDLLAVFFHRHDAKSS